MSFCTLNIIGSVRASYSHISDVTLRATWPFNTARKYCQKYYQKYHRQQPACGVFAYFRCHSSLPLSGLLILRGNIIGKTNENIIRNIIKHIIRNIIGSLQAAYSHISDLTPRFSSMAFSYSEESCYYDSTDVIHTHFIHPQM